MSLNKNIRKKLVETKTQKENLLIERNIIESRLLMIADPKTLKNFDSLDESQKDKIFNNFISEVVYLNEAGLVNEQLGDIMKSLFGNALPGVLQTFMERIVNSIFNAIGIPDNYFRKVMVSYFSSHPIDAIKSLNDCKLMTKLMVEALIEAVVVQYKQAKGISNVFADTLRNTVIEAIDNSETVTKLTTSLSGVVCEMVSKITGKAKNVVSGLQTQPATA
jgi:hypothetical protein